MCWKNIVLKELLSVLGLVEEWIDWNTNSVFVQMTDRQMEQTEKQGGKNDRLDRTNKLYFQKVKNLALRTQ